MDYFKYDFQNDSKFQDYIQDFDEVPKDLEKYKRKWFKKNINPEFDLESINPTPDQQQPQPEKPKQEEKQDQQKPQSQPQPQPHQAQPKPQPQPQPQQQLPPPLPFMYVIEGTLKVLYFPGLLFLMVPEYGKFVNIWCIVICLMAIYRQHGKPQLNQIYFSTIIQNEFTTNLFYIILLFVNQASLPYHMPLALHFLSGAAEFWCRLSGEQGFTLKAATYLRTNRNALIITKQKIEVYLLFYSVIGVLMGKSSFFIPIFLFQNIALKSKSNANMRNAQAYMRVWYANNLSENQKVPEGIRKILQLIWKGYEKIINII